jgi:hypothetical protein
MYNFPIKSLNTFTLLDPGRQLWSDQSVLDLKHQINLLGTNIRAKPYDTSNKSRYFSFIKNLKKLIKQKNGPI